MRRRKLMDGEDEARVGQKTQLGRRWAKRGTRPVAVLDQRTASTYIFDQAGWHVSAKLIVPPNITLVPLPPKCPELNPIENVWQYMRANWLSDRIFEAYDDIVDHCSDAWNKLAARPWTIMSIGMRDWANAY